MLALSFFIVSETSIFPKTGEIGTVFLSNLCQFFKIAQDYS